MLCGVPQPARAQEPTSLPDSAGTLFMAGQDARDRGTPQAVDRAIGLWLEAARLFGRLGDRRLLGLTLQQIALAHDAVGRPDSADFYQRYVRRVARGESTPWLEIQFAVPDGFSVGANGALVSNRGRGAEVIQPGPGFDGTLRITRGSFQAGVGLLHSFHGIEAIRQNYGLVGIFGEPRILFRGISDRVVAFVGVRGGWFNESVREPGGNFSASGFAVGASGGVDIQLTTHVAIETGVGFDKQWFGDFTFKGENAWLPCLGGLRDLRIVLPAAVAMCSPEVDGEPIRQDVDERFLHPGTARATSRLRLFTGVVISFGSF